MHNHTPTWDRFQANTPLDPKEARAFAAIKVIPQILIDFCDLAGELYHSKYERASGRLIWELMRWSPDKRAANLRKSIDSLDRFKFNDHMVPTLTRLCGEIMVSSGELPADFFETRRTGGENRQVIAKAPTLQSYWDMIREDDR